MVPALPRFLLLLPAGDSVGLTKVFVRLLALVFAATLFVPVVTAFCSRLNDPSPWTAATYLTYLAIGAALAAVAFGVLRLLRSSERSLDDLFADQTRFFDELPVRWVDVAIFGSAALSLFLELTVIRWQGTVFEFFAFYKNFTLLSCFAGLGLGYSLSSRDRTPLAAVVPLLAWHFVFLIAFRFGMPEWSLASVRNLPFQEQLNMGVNVLTTFAEGVGDLLFPLGRVRDDGDHLSPHRADVWPPDAAAAEPARLRLEPARQPRGRRADLRRQLPLDAAARLVRPVARRPAAVLCAASGQRDRRRRGVHRRAGHPGVAGQPALAEGLLALSTARARPYAARIPRDTRGRPLLSARPRSVEAERRSMRKRPASATTTTCRTGSTVHRSDVAVVGAGSGNDVAAAVRSGAARIDAIEIDPGDHGGRQGGASRNTRTISRRSARSSTTHGRFCGTATGTTTWSCMDCSILIRCSAMPRASGSIRLSIPSRDSVTRGRA